MVNVIAKIIKQPQKLIYGFERMGLLDWLNDERYIQMTYRFAFGRRLNLKQPRAFTEKLNWYKLNYSIPLMRQCVDKYDVREYVEKNIGRGYLNECFGLWNEVNEIPFKKLPDKFVLKPTNGSGDVVICENKKSFNWEKAKKTLIKNSRRHFSSKTREWVYYGMPYRIIGERYICSSDENQIKDYKIFCFYGEPKFLYVASERGTENLKFDFFDLDWNWLPVTNGHEHNQNLSKPEHFTEMLDVARKLSKPFPHVRVDLYEEEGQIYFGELTFYHNGGFSRFEPDEWDFKFGEYFDIGNIQKDK